MKKNKSFKTGGAAAEGAVEGGAVEGGALSPSPTTNQGNLPNISLFTIIGPYILIGFFILLSIFNLNIKGVMYISGLIFVLFFSNILKLIIPKRLNLNPDCTIYTGPSSLGFRLPFSTIVYTYTFIYLLIPMIVNSMMNYAILISLLMVLSSDIMIMLQTCNVKFTLLLMTIVMVVIIGGAWTMIINSYMSDVTYHTDYLSDKQVCSMPSKQNFKCSVYKNGELISSMTK